MLGYSLSEEQIKSDLRWLWDHSVPAQISRLNLMISQGRAGDIEGMKKTSRRGIQVSLENLAIGLALGGAVASGGVHAYRAYRMAKLGMGASKRVSPMVWRARILKEAWDGDLEWQDIPYYAAPFVAQETWDRYVESESSVQRRSGNADGSTGGTKKPKSSTKRRSRKASSSSMKWCRVHKKVDSCWRKKKK